MRPICSGAQGIPALEGFRPMAGNPAVVCVTAPGFPAIRFTRTSHVAIIVGFTPNVDTPPRRDALCSRAPQARCLRLTDTATCLGLVTCTSGSPRTVVITHTRVTSNRRRHPRPDHLKSSPYPIPGDAGFCGQLIHEDKPRGCRRRPEMRPICSGAQGVPALEGFRPMRGNPAVVCVTAPGYPAN